MEDVLAAPNAYVRATETAQYVRSQLPEALQNPKVAIVCGSGLGGLADTIEPEPKVELAYGSIPNFPKSTGMCASLELEEQRARVWLQQDRRANAVKCSPGSCRQVCVWSDRAAEDACSASGRTSTVRNNITLWHNARLTCLAFTRVTQWTW
jgi:hypothetical protein